ncbi:DMT family transporter [Prevotella sp. E2-28]|uniref:DMT family transporter n=1 Tax=Prevotella sp. E2-28 TaxID=2913620 RepID=UPI001EDC3053|nr:DMT family transporter [Prevotella sp. E2-28]UKK54952.1 DMT family transporter [Prevotella sp. E2-28]
MSKTNIFQRPLWAALFAFTAAFLWGWAYPFIKLGFDEFEITTEMTGSKMLFAGIRFFLSGVIILTVARLTHRSFSLKDEAKSSLLGSSLFLLLFTLLNTTLHYACFYIGLSHSQGSRAAILNSLSVFVLVLLACMFFKSDKLTIRKIMGCTIGFSGILSLNLGGAESGTFTLLGDGMIILNALCGAFAGLMTRGVGKRVDVFVGTGYSLGIGGALLMIPGLLMGGTLPHVTLLGLFYLLMLIGISTIGFTLYNKLLTCNPVGKIAIWNSLIPVVGAVTSCLCLSEEFQWKYAVAATLTTTGIYIINKGKK